MHPELSLVQPTVVWVATNALAACFIVCLLLFHRRISATLRRRCADLEAALSERTARQQRDLAEFRRLEAALHQSETLINEVLNSLSAHIAVLDTQGVIVAVNAAWRRFAEQNGGASALCQVGSNYLAVCRNVLAGRDNADARAALAGIRAMLDGAQIPFSLEYPCHSPTQQRWFEMRVYPLSGDRGGVVVAHEDITARRQAEDRLHESEANLAAILNNSPESAMLMDEHGTIIAANEIFGQRLGQASAALIGRCAYDLISPELAERRQAHVAEALRIGQPIHFEDQRDGLWLSHYLRPIRDAAGDVRRIAVFGMDITERRRIEQSLRRQTELLAAIRQAQNLFILHSESSTVFRELLDILVTATDSEYGFLDEVLHDPDGTPYKLSLALSDIAWDENSRRLYQQLVARNLEFRKLDNLGGAPVLERRVIITNDAPRDPRYRGLPEGHPPLRRYLGIPLFFGEELLGVAGIANRPGGYDLELAAFLEPLTTTCAHLIWAVRARRQEQQAAEALGRSEERYRRIVETSNEGIWAMDGDYRTTFVNHRIADLLGYVPAEMIGRRVDAFMFAEDLGDHGAEMARRAQGQSAVYERRFRRKDGGVLWTIVSATALRDRDGRFAGSFAMFTDITERKRAEEALWASEAKLKSIFRAAPVGIGLVSKRVFVEANDMLCQMTGYSRQEMIGQSARLLYPTDQDYDYVGQEKYRQIAATGTGTVETRWRRKDGAIIEILLSSTPLDTGDLVKGVTFTALDITDRKQAEKALRVALTKYKTLFDAFPLGITVTDAAGNIVEANPISERLLGIARAEHYQRGIDGPAWRIVRSDGTPMPAEEYASVRALRNQCLVENVEMGIVKPQEEISWLRVTAAPLPLEEYGVVVAYGDITERKRAEEALRASEEKYRTVADFTHDWEYWIDPDGRYRYVSPSCECVTGFGPEEWMSDPGLLMTIIHPDDRERVAAHFRNETSETVDFRIIARDGREVWIGHVSRPVHGSDGRYLGRRGSNRDITKRKRMEVALRDSLEEKETLLREVHHRVKNNLTAIISLLELQRGTLADATSLGLLNELGSRIRSMALVHEMLYQSNNLNQIDFQGYLRTLVGFLRDSFDPHGAIRLDMAAPDVGMNLDTAIPCGLIVTELVINALKYAFPEHRPRPEANTCEISVTAAWDGVTYSLVVADNGVGLPADLDWTTTRTLGLRLVRMLGQHQLRGKLELDRTAGTRFSLRFGSINYGGNAPHDQGNHPDRRG